MTDNRLIVALDFTDHDDVYRLVERLGDRVGFYKVGLELLTDGGMEVCRLLRKQGKKVFLDWKLHDIPNTVEQSARSIAQQGCDFLTVHGRHGVVEAALRGVKGTETRILAVTLLTSMPRDDQTDATVQSLAQKAFENGAHGIVSSAHELGLVDKQDGRIFVTPGIRMPDDDAGDQQRIATPSQALKLGATHLVVGRPITRSSDPVTATERILEDMVTK